MQIIKVKDYEEMSDEASAIVLDEFKVKQNVTLGLATGSSPIGLYKRLIKAYEAGQSFLNARTINLDEYVGIGESSPNSYVTFMRNELFNRIDIDLKNTFLPDGLAADPKKECERFSEIIEAYPRDVQILGIGQNGHIGFNEPKTPFDSKTHIVNLTMSTIKANSRLFENKSLVPRRAITMGIAEIMQAKKIVLLASGKNKARAVYNAIKGKLTTLCPASVLRLHPNAIFIIDEAAYEML